VVLNPIYRSKGQKNNNKITVTINRRDNPFIYTQTNNKLLIVGYNNLAFLQSNGTTVGGCASICADTEVKNKFYLGTLLQKWA